METTQICHFCNRPLNPIITNPSKELAEFIGIMLGDGNLGLYNRAYKIRICGHSSKDKDYLLKFVKPLAEKLFNEKFKTYIHNNNCLYLMKDSKKIFATLIHFGLKSGNKKLNNISIPKWIFSSNEYVVACVRGLIDTDGSVVNVKGRRCSFIYFKTGIPNIVKSFTKCMKMLGFRTSKWNHQSNTSQLSICGRDMVKKYYKEVGFNNPKHANKFKIFF